MHLAYVSLTGRGRTDACLTAIANKLTAEGLQLAGCTASAPITSGAHPCDMDLRVLPDGPDLRISQMLGTGARGCRLDGTAVEQAAMLTAGRLDAATLLIVNKFGKLEAAGRGFVPVIADALDRGMPVLVGVNGLNLPAFLEFAGGMAVELAPEEATILVWFRTAVAKLLNDPWCSAPITGWPQSPPS